MTTYFRKELKSKALLPKETAGQTARLRSYAACFLVFFARVRMVCAHMCMCINSQYAKVAKNDLNPKYYSHFKSFNMKKVFLFAAASIALVSCQNDEFSALSNGESSSPQITFGIGVPGSTRATTLVGEEAADRLGGNFLVHGFKYYGTEPTTDLVNPSKQQEVFDYYNVNYISGSAMTTQTNTTGWEYAGYLTPSGEDQTIKYWDYEASGYVFSAVSGTGIKARKIEATDPVASVYDKGWYVQIPAGGSLSDLYASARHPMPKPASGASYDETVNLTFYSMITKVRFAIYETVPGYKVSIDRFYYKGQDKWNKTADNFAISGSFRTLNSDAETPVKVVYYDNKSAIENQPKVVLDENNVGKPAAMLFGTNIQAQPAIGTTSVEATYDQANKGYTCVLPYADVDNTLTLYVDYTLTADNGETIHVKHASAKVPANYTQWKENFAYTYLFKISDKTNGTTGDPGTPDPDDPDDPTLEPNDPAGLYPISFDACVVSSQNGIQENITSVSEPSITTYQYGAVVTTNDEYTPGEVYYTVMEGASLADIKEAAKVFEVYNYGKEATTESVVKNWKTNYVILTPVHVDAATKVPTTDGTDLTFDAKKCYKFNALPGKLYAIQYTAADGVETYKLVKVTGNDTTAPSFVVTIAQDQKLSNLTDAIKCRITNDNGKGDSKAIAGAKPLIQVLDASGADVTTKFVITEGTDGEYIIQISEPFVKAGANGTYVVKCYEREGNNTFAVDMKYFFVKSKVTVVAGSSPAQTVLNYSTAVIPLAGADIICDVPGITVADNKNGVYTITAGLSVPFGTYTATIAGQTLTIEVVNYAFNKNEIVITKKLSGESTASLTLNKNGETSDVSYVNLMGQDNDVAVISGTGVFTLTAVKGGKYTLSYEATKCDVTVNEYSLSVADNSVVKATGRTTIALSLNEKPVNAALHAVSCTGKPEGASYTLTSNGKDLVFANATKAGDYVFQYTVDGVVVAQATVTVTD